MAQRDHDGSEHAGTRAWDRGHDRDTDRDSRSGAGQGEAAADRGPDPSPADQWFGDASPPPPPYAIDEGALPPPPYAVGGAGPYAAEQPNPQYPAGRQRPQPPEHAPDQVAGHPGQPGYPGRQGMPGEQEHPGRPQQGQPAGPPQGWHRDQHGPAQGPPPGPQQPSAPAGRPSAPHQQPEPPQPAGHQQPSAPEHHPSGPYPAGPPPAAQPSGPQQPQGGHPSGPQQFPPPADRPAAPVAYNGQPMRQAPVRPADGSGAVPPVPAPPGADPAQGGGWAPPAESGQGPPPAPGPGAGELVPGDGDPQRPAADAGSADETIRRFPDPATEHEHQQEQQQEPAERGAPEPASESDHGPAPESSANGFAQWAPPERAPGPESRPNPAANGSGPRPQEHASTEVFPPVRGDFPEPLAAPPEPGIPAPPQEPPRSSAPGRGGYAGTGPQWTTAEPAPPPEPEPDAERTARLPEPPASPPLVGDGPGRPPRPQQAPDAPGSPAGGEDIPDPEQLPPLPPHAARRGPAPGQGPPADMPPPPGPAPYADADPAAAPPGPGQPGQHSAGTGGWSWSPPAAGEVPREAWAPPAEPGHGTGGNRPPAPPHPPQHPGWEPGSAPSGPQPGPQAWNAAPPPVPDPGPAQQRPASGPQPAAGQQPYDPYRHGGGHNPAGAPPPPPGPPGGYGPPGYPPPGERPGYPGQAPSGAQPGFQYHAHFADGVQPAHPGQGGQPETSDDLRADNLVSGKRSGPSKGWRKVLHSATFGMVDVGESAAEQRRRELTERARTHVGGGHHRVAVLSLKGGVGKTTTTVALGSMLASLRGDRVLAVDANPDRGTLSDKVQLETAATIRDLLNEKEAITRYADIRGFTSQALSRLEILASDRDPAVSEAFSEDDYREVCWLLEHYYSICLTDCGTGLLHSAMRGVLGLSDQVVLVSSASVDGARSASATLDWLEAHQYGSLVRGAVVVLSMVRTSKSSVDLDRLEQHFASRCRAVVRVPWDAHLEEGAEVDLDRLAAPTRDSYLQLAATVGEAFAWPR
ncbi:hypothetical protein GCM10027570_33430 [Streptomonospora sediminis]